MPSALPSVHSSLPIYEQIGGAEKGMPDFAEKYEDTHAFLKEDWYQAFQSIRILTSSTRIFSPSGSSLTDSIRCSHSQNKNTIPASF